MQSVFGMHDRSRFNVFLYTTSPWDGTAYRPRIASMVEHCGDVSSWSLNTIIDHIMQQEIHIRNLTPLNCIWSIRLQSGSDQPGWVYEGREERYIRGETVPYPDSAHRLRGDAWRR